MNKRILFVVFLTVLAAIPCRAQNLRVMTFNIRYDNKSDSRSGNGWDSRKDSLCRYVREVGPDVFGMQEVLHNQLEDLTERLDDWTYVGVGRDDGKRNGEYNPVFYRKSRFNLLAKGWFWLSPTPEVPSFGWNSACRRMAVWVVLEDKESKERFLFCNSHFDHVSLEARKHSAMLCKERLSSLSKEYSSNDSRLPLVFTADFNTNAQEETYGLLRDWEFPIKDVWRVADMSEGGPATFNDWGRRPNVAWSKIDFIFVSAEARVARAVIHDSNMGGGHFLSDHNAHWAEINFSNK